MGMFSRVPVILQTEAAECALACLAMVAGYHRYHIDLVSLRRRFPLPPQGTSLATLVELADSLALSARALRLEPDAVGQLQLPCVLHWDMNHFVVLVRVGRRAVVIHDPASGRRLVNRCELGRHMTGVALELLPTSAFTPQRLEQPLKLSHLWSSATGLRRSLLALLLLSILLQLIAVASPLYLQTVIDDVLLRSDLHFLSVLAIGFALLLIMEVVISSLRQTLVVALAARLNLQIAVNVFRHLIRLPLDFFGKRHLGDVVSRFGSINAIRDLLSESLVAACIDALMLVLTLVVMFAYSLTLTLVSLAFCAVFVLLRCALYPLLRQHTEQLLVVEAQKESSFMEAVRAIQTIKLCGRETERQAKWQNQLVVALNRTIRLARLGIVAEAISTLLFGAAHIAVVFIAAREVMAGAMSVGMIYAYLSFQQRFVGSVDTLIDHLLQFRMIKVHLQRLADIVYTAQDPVVSLREGCQAAPTVRGSQSSGSLVAREISYAHGTGLPAVFSAVSLEIMPGECVALAGASGTGKSTLLKCLMGLLQPQSGAVYLGDIPILQLPGFRERIGAVMQDDCLLSGTILDNITGFASHLDIDRAVAAAVAARIHGDIQHMPMQYNTLVGDLGANLSGGQLQRVLIARALYAQPKLLFLDEATSHLDPDNEAEVMRAIAQLQITRIIVAHRPETLRWADRVIQLDVAGLRAS
jgi:ATP-binding cassette subfamily B protein RaxB